jgi:hypothetical protein
LTVASHRNKALMSNRQDCRRMKFHRMMPNPMRASR